MSAVSATNSRGARKVPTWPLYIRGVDDCPRVLVYFRRHRRLGVDPVNGHGTSQMGIMGLQLADRLQSSIHASAQNSLALNLAEVRRRSGFWRSYPLY